MKKRTLIAVNFLHPKAYWTIHHNRYNELEREKHADKQQAPPTEEQRQIDEQNARAAAYLAEQEEQAKERQ